MLGNLILEMCNAPGTAADCNLLGPTSGRLPFGFWFATGAQCFYVMTDGTQEEWGIGTYTAGSPNKLNRTTVIKNSANSTARLNFLGTTKIYNETPAERSLWIDNSNNLNISGVITAQSMSVSNAVGPLLALQHTAAALDAKNWEIVSQSGNFYGRSANDTNNAWTNWLTVTRGTGTAIGAITLAGTNITLAGAVATNALAVTGALTASGDITSGGIATAQFVRARQVAGYPQVQFWNTTGSTDQKRTVLFQDPTGNFQAQFNSDNDAAAAAFLQVTRSGYAVATMTLTAPTINLTGAVMASANVSVSQGVVYRSLNTNIMGFGWDAGNSIINAYVDTFYQGGIAMRGWVSGNFIPVGTYTPNQNVNTGQSPSFNTIYACNDVSCYWGSGGSGRVFEYAIGWYWDWNISNGTIQWIASGTGNLSMRAGPDWLVWNASGPVAGYGAYQNLSDIRGKRDVQPAAVGLAEVLRIEPVSFRRVRKAGTPLPDHEEIGFSAQQLRDIIPLSVRVVGLELPDGTGGLDSDEPSLAVSTDGIVAALVNAIREMHEKLSEANDRIANLERRAAA
jgi:hypothetical protein